MITATRSSTPTKAVSDQNGLVKFLVGTGVQRVVNDPLLLAKAQIIGMDGPWQDVHAIAVEAEAKYAQEAGIGTAIHATVSAIVGGRDMGQMSEDILRPAEAVLKTISDLGFDVIGSEVPCACLHAFDEAFAGTTDLVLKDRVTGTVYIGDIKSTGELGRAKFRALDWAGQTAIYACSEPYDLQGLPDYRRDRYGRPIIDPTRIGRWDDPISQDRAVILEVCRSTSEVEPHAVDLVAGRAVIELACKVREMRKGTFLVDSL